MQVKIDEILLFLSAPFTKVLIFHGFWLCVVLSALSWIAVNINPLTRQDCKTLQSNHDVNINFHSGFGLIFTFDSWLFSFLSYKLSSESKMNIYCILSNISRSFLFIRVFLNSPICHNIENGSEILSFLLATL